MIFCVCADLNHCLKVTVQYMQVHRILPSAAFCLFFFHELEKYGTVDYTLCTIVAFAVCKVLVWVKLINNVTQYCLL